MSGYRLYLFDGQPHLGERLTRMTALTAETEAEAIAEGEAFRDGQYAELWHLEHLVKIFEAD